MKKTLILSIILFRFVFFAEGQRIEYHGAIADILPNNYITTAHSEIICKGDTCYAITNAESFVPFILKSVDGGRSWDISYRDSLAKKKGGLNYAHNNIINLKMKDDYVFATGDSNIVYLKRKDFNSFERLMIQYPDPINYYNIGRPAVKQFMSFIDNDKLYHFGHSEQFVYDLETNITSDIEAEIFDNILITSSEFGGYTKYNNTNYLLFDRYTWDSIAPGKGVSSELLLSDKKGFWDLEILLTDTLKPRLGELYGGIIYGGSAEFNSLASRNNKLYLGGYYGDSIAEDRYRYHDQIISLNPETYTIDTLLNTRLSEPKQDHNGIFDIKFLNDSLSYAISTHTLYRTESAWHEWEAINVFDTVQTPGSSFFKDAMNSFDFLSDGTLLIMSTRGYIYRYHHYPVSVEEELGDNDYVNGGIVVYPQPAIGGNLNVNTIGGGLLKLYSLTGKLLNESYVEGGMQTTSLDITELTSGSYLLIFQPSDGEVIMKNIVVGE